MNTDTTNRPETAALASNLDIELALENLTPRPETAALENPVGATTGLGSVAPESVDHDAGPPRPIVVAFPGTTRPTVARVETSSVPTPDEYGLISVYQIRERPYGRIIDPNNPSEQAFFSDIAARGVQMPIVVRPIDQAGFEVINGARRLTGATLAGQLVIPCLIRVVDAAQARIERVRDEQMTKACNPIELARTVWEALKIHLNLDDAALESWLERHRNIGNGRVQNRSTWSAPGNPNDVYDVADLTNKTATLLAPIMRPATLHSSYRPLLKLSSRLRELVENNTLSASVARTLASMRDEKLRDQIIADAATNGISVRALNAKIKQQSPGSTQPGQTPVEPTRTQNPSFAVMGPMLDRILAGEFGSKLQGQVDRIALKAIAAYDLALQQAADPTHANRDPGGQHATE
jgi:ParB-like chromosome segregation protein Spo0J